jgi:hypothetical protein
MAASITRYINKIAQVLLQVLFIYSGIVKLMSLQKFRTDMARSPLIPENMLNFLQYLIPGTEILVVILLVFASTKRFGFYGGFFLLSLFTVYLIALVSAFSNLPCSCGGILGGMSYPAHIAFNIVFTLVALAGIYTSDAEVHSSVEHS